MSLKINPILPKHQSPTNYNPKITPKVVDKTKQNNQAINRLAVRFGGDDETKPAKKTIDDFFNEVKKEQRIDAKFSRKLDISLYLEPKKSSKNMSLEDYTETFDKALFKKAGYEGKLTKDDLKLAGEIMRKDGWNWEKWNVESLRKTQDKTGAMFAYTSESAIEKAKIAGQSVLRFREYEATLKDSNNAAGENETNQMLLDHGKVLWNSLVNNVEGGINTGIDGILSNGGQNPLVLINPNRPRVDLSGIKADYRSEMMRRDINGKLDGNGLKRGDFTEGAVTILAPFVVGSKVNNITRMTGDIVKPKIGNINIPIKVEVGTATTAEGLQIPVITTETKPLREVFGKPKDLSIFESRANGFPNQRIPGKDGNWNGKVGESGWLSSKPEVIAVTKGKPVPYKKGFPVFDKWKVGEVKLPKMKGNHTTDFDDADELFALQKKWYKPNGTPDTAKVAKLRTDSNLTWHHHEDMTTMQLVPKSLNNEIPHTGGVSFVKRANKK